MDKIHNITANGKRIGEVADKLDEKFNSDRDVAKAVAFGKFNKKTKVKQLLRIK